MPRTSSRASRPGERGFTLLEILIAIAIFAFVAAAAMQTMANADYMAGSGKRARELRMLAERKLGDILAYEQHYDVDNDEGDLGDDYPEYKDEAQQPRFRDWKWHLEVANPDPTFFGISSEDDATYFFAPPTDEEKTKASTPGTTNPGTSVKNEVKLRKLTLKVAAPDEDGGSDSVEIVMFAPTIKRSKAAGAKSE